MEKKDGATIIRLGILDIFIVSFGLVAWLFALYYETVEKLLPAHTSAVILIILMFSLASVTFFGIMSFSQKSSGVWLQNKGGTRVAIMTSFMLVYFFLLGINVFLFPPDEMAEITRTLIENFTYILGIVIAFYFGSSAYVQAHVKNSNSGEVIQKETKTKTE
jgi:hypothetical protein